MIPNHSFTISFIQGSLTLIPIPSTLVPTSEGNHFCLSVLFACISRYLYVYYSHMYASIMYITLYLILYSHAYFSSHLV